MAIGETYQIFESKVTNPPLELVGEEGSFCPNPVTVRFARCLDIHFNDTVFDIGTGIGPLAIYAALNTSGRVYGVDPVEMHVRCARMNVERYGLEDRVSVYKGKYFEPFEQEEELKDVRADVVIGDVSGIATPVSYALNWYSTKVPTGGDDGTEVICEFLKRASRGPVKPDVRVYFPVAVDLSDKDKILDAVSKNFNKVENAWKKEYIEFPLSEPEVQAIHDVYEGRVPRFINVQKSRKGSFWRGQILMATYPKFR